MLLAALSMALGTVMIRQVCRYADPISATGWHMFLGGLPLFLGSGVWESQQWVNLTVFRLASDCLCNCFWQCDRIRTILFLCIEGKFD